MEKVNVILIDDEVLFLRDLEAKLAKFSVFEVLGSYTAVDDAVADLVTWEKKVDVLFCDIQMPEGLGTEAVPDLWQFAHMIVFCTGHDSFAVASYKLRVDDYIMKPVERSDLLRVLEKVKEMRSKVVVETPVNYFLIKKPNVMEWIPIYLRDIVLFHKHEQEVDIYGRTDGKLVVLGSVSMTIREVYERVESTGLFVYANQSIVLAFDHIKTVRKNTTAVAVEGWESKKENKDWIRITSTAGTAWEEYLRRHQFKLK